jgi:hypothetical protein
MFLDCGLGEFLPEIDLKEARDIEETIEWDQKQRLGEELIETLRGMGSEGSDREESDDESQPFYI